MDGRERLAGLADHLAEAAHGALQRRDGGRAARPAPRSGPAAPRTGRRCPGCVPRPSVRTADVTRPVRRRPLSCGVGTPSPHLRRSACARWTTRSPATSWTRPTAPSSARARPCAAGSRPCSASPRPRATTHGPAQRRRDLPGDAGGDPRGRAHDRLPDLRLLEGRHRPRVRARPGRARPRRRARCGCSSTPSAAGSSTATCSTHMAECGVHVEWFRKPVWQGAGAVAVQAEPPHPPQGAHLRRARSASPAASASPRSGAATPATRREWRDTHVRVVGPAVDGLAASFAQNWAETGHPLIDDDRTLPRARARRPDGVRRAGRPGQRERRLERHGHGLPRHARVGAGAAAHDDGVLRARRHASSSCCSTPSRAACRST